MKFRYFKEGDATEERGQVMRVLAENSKPYLLRKLDGSDLQVPEDKTFDEARGEAELSGDVFKVKEVNFDDWAEYIPEEWGKNPEEGYFEDPEFGQLSLDTGEPK